MWWLLFLLLWIATPAWGAATFGTAGSVDIVGDTQGSSLTIASFTCTNDNTALYVAAHINEGTAVISTVTGITYKSLTMSDFINVGTRTTPTLTGTRFLTLSVWRAKPGAACDGTAGALSMTISQAKIWGMGAMSVTGVDPTTPEDTAVIVATDGTPAPDPTGGTVSSVTDDLVVHFVAWRNTQTLVAVAGQTDQYFGVTNHATGSQNVRWRAATEPGAGSVVGGWTTTGGGSQEWIVISMNVNQFTAPVTRRRTPPPARLLQHFEPNERRLLWPTHLMPPG